MDVVREQLRNALGIEIDELAGAHASVVLPVTAGLVNRLIAARLTAQAPVSAVRVEPQDGNAIDVHVTPRSRLLPAIRVQARIERQPALPEHPRLLLRWAIPGAGALARLASPFIASLKSLPPGVRIDGEFAIIDLAELLAAQGHAGILQYVKALRIDTRPGAFVVSADVGV